MHGCIVVKQGSALDVFTGYNRTFCVEARVDSAVQKEQVKEGPQCCWKGYDFTWSIYGVLRRDAKH